MKDLVFVVVMASSLVIVMLLFVLRQLAIIVDLLEGL